MGPHRIAALAALAVLGCRKPEEPSGGASQRKGLDTLGYLATMPVGDRETMVSGVMRLEPRAVAAGITIICDVAFCNLIDMSGRTVHRIHLSSENLNAGSLLVDYDDSHFLILDKEIAKTDWLGKVEWQTHSEDVVFHHDVAVREDKTILALYAGERWIAHDGARIPILDNGIATIHADGSFARSVSFFDVLAAKLRPGVLDEIKQAVEAGTLAVPATRLKRRLKSRFAAFGNITDAFHANGLTIAPRDTAKWKQGDYIVCFRELGGNGGVYVIDHSSLAVRWSFEDVEKPHAPSQLPSGNILLFDNGPKRQWSRVIEIDPVKNAIVHEYRSQQPLFFSDGGSGVQALPNGNQLVTEMRRGHVFEITPSGQVVWDYWNPVSTTESHGKQVRSRAAIYRARRVTESSSTTIAPLRALVQAEQRRVASLAPIRKELPPQREARVYPEGPGPDFTPFMTFVLTETAGAITYKATSTALPPGRYRVMVAQHGCGEVLEAPLADLGTFESTGESGELALSGSTNGKAPEGGLAHLVDLGYLAVLREGTQRPIACAKVL